MERCSHKGNLIKEYQEKGYSVPELEQILKFSEIKGLPEEIEKEIANLHEKTKELELKWQNEKEIRHSDPLYFLFLFIDSHGKRQPKAWTAFQGLKSP